MIKVENVSFSYENEENLEEGQKLPLALKDVSFHVDKGDFVAVIGHNGSGKSTLAKLLNGMFVPHKGSVLVNGIDTKDDELSLDVRRTVGMVLQNPDNQIISSVVEEDVAFGPENLGVPAPEIRQRVDDALRAVGMYDFRLHEPHKLSGGQKQRIAIAGILAMSPEFIVLDESTAMLDPQGRTEVLNTVFELNKTENMGVVLITHFMEEAVRAKRVVVMAEGRVVLEGTPREVFSNINQLKKIQLDVPQPTELAEKLRNMGMDIKTGILTVEECVDELTKILEG